MGPAGLVSMEDTLATELVQFATASRRRRAFHRGHGPRRPDDRQIGSGIAEGRIPAFLARISGADGAMSGKCADYEKRLRMKTKLEGNDPSRYKLQSALRGATLQRDRPACPAEEWPNFFTEDCIYEIIPKENADLGLPMRVSCTGFWSSRCCVTVSSPLRNGASSSRISPTGTSRPRDSS